MLTTNPSLSRDQFFHRLRRAEHCVLMLDYDGTLAPYRIDPQAATPYPGVVPLVNDIMREGRTRVVFVSGRRAQEIVFLLGLYPPPEIWGCHGLQHLLPDGRQETLKPEFPVTEALTEAAEWLKEHGLRPLAEFKPGSIAVHWRGLPPEQAHDIRKQLITGWEPITHRARVKFEDFDCGLELRMLGRDKGDVVRMIVDSTPDGAALAFLGNDRADEDAFRALDGAGLAVRVVTDERETSADLRLHPPQELLRFLSDWLEARLPDSSSPRNGSSSDESIAAEGEL